MFRSLKLVGADFKLSTEIIVEDGQKVFNGCLTRIGEPFFRQNQVEFISAAGFVRGIVFCLLQAGKTAVADDKDIKLLFFSNGHIAHGWQKIGRFVDIACRVATTVEIVNLSSVTKFF